VRAEGLRGIYKGLGPTMARQGANSAVRLTTYSTLRGLATKDGRKTNDIETFGMGAVAGIVTVCESTERNGGDCWWLMVPLAQTARCHLSELPTAESTQPRQYITAESMQPRLPQGISLLS